MNLLQSWYHMFVNTYSINNILNCRQSRTFGRNEINVNIKTMHVSNRKNYSCLQSANLVHYKTIFKYNEKSNFDKKVGLII